MSRDIFDADIDHEIETGMNLAALRYDLKLCREHGTYVDLETLASAIHDVLGDDTEKLATELSFLTACERTAKSREDLSGTTPESEQPRDRKP